MLLIALCVHKVDGWFCNVWLSDSLGGTLIITSFQYTSYILLNFNRRIQAILIVWIMVSSDSLPLVLKETMFWLKYCIVRPCIHWSLDSSNGYGGYKHFMYVFLDTWQVPGYLIPSLWLVLIDADTSLPTGWFIYLFFNPQMLKMSLNIQERWVVSSNHAYISACMDTENTRNFMHPSTCTIAQEMFICYPLMES